mmetsp:Transcript_49926/g.150160  ORF Transcript_49926/g.150160 Transcript_49926/m.150160 type:complete len:211 (-) Transcript_49926:584-1216(-)
MAARRRPRRTLMLRSPPSQHTGTTARTSAPLKVTMLRLVKSCSKCGRSAKATPVKSTLIWQLRTRSALKRRTKSTRLCNNSTNSARMMPPCRCMKRTRLQSRLSPRRMLGRRRRRPRRIPMHRSAPSPHTCTSATTSVQKSPRPTPISPLPKSPRYLGRSGVSSIRERGVGKGPRSMMTLQLRTRRGMMQRRLLMMPLRKRRRQRSKRRR